MCIPDVFWWMVVIKPVAPKRSLCCWSALLVPGVQTPPKSPVAMSFHCYWLVDWTPVKNISQLGWLFPKYEKTKNVPNHQPGYFAGSKLRYGLRLDNLQSRCNPFRQHLRSLKIGQRVFCSVHIQPYVLWTEHCCIETNHTSFLSCWKCYF